MFRPMRRAVQQLNDDEVFQILEQKTSGVLAVLGDGGYPYAVPMSYVFERNFGGFGRLIFHSAKDGHKIDAISREPKASFCVVDRDFVVPAEYTTYFRSVIAFGKIRVLGAREAREAAKALGKKYRPGFEEELAATVERNLDKMAVLSLEIEHLTGKEAIELVRERG